MKDDPNKDPKKDDSKDETKKTGEGEKDKPDEKPKDKPKDNRERCRFFPGDGGKPTNALINSRARNDINVVELEIRGDDGRSARVESVPRWNEKGQRPEHDCWAE